MVARPLRKKAIKRLGFSALTRRILTLNIAGLAALVGGILYISEFREGIIDARVESLLVQGEIIAGAISASVQIETDIITLDPEQMLDLQRGETFTFRQDPALTLEFPINPEQVAPVLRRLVSPTRTRARIYDRDGGLILDSRSLFVQGDILRYDLPPPEENADILNNILSWLELHLFRPDLPTYFETDSNDGRSYPEVSQALNGQKASIVRQTRNGEAIVTVAVPIQRFRAIGGVLLLSTQPGDIDAIVQTERLSIVRVFLVALAVMTVLSILLASTIAGPVHRLSDAAELVRRRVRGRVEIPDFSSRNDEIGHLSTSLRDMTRSLYSRIEAIERFAADVAHELKNPLTSLRSAVETLPLAKTDDARTRLLEVIAHDVNRLDRLISDIADASRLDAELQRHEGELVNIKPMLQTIVEIANEMHYEEVASVKLTLPTKPVYVLGSESRLGQVINNLLDNARSFSPPDHPIRLICSLEEKQVIIRVEDNGPGIRPDALERIFERFYTDRPKGAFGQNSGLGLSISKQIIEAHGGTITAQNNNENKSDEKDKKTVGAKFIITLPACSPTAKA